MEIFTNKVLAQIRATERDKRCATALRNSLEQGLYPFRPRLEIFIQERLHDFPAVVIEIQSWFKHRHKYDPMELYSVDDLSFIFAEAGYEAGQAFRSIPRVEPEDNIILGEE